MIEPGKIACHAYGETVNVKLSRKSFLFILTRDNAPSLSNTVKPEHVLNRSLVSQGKIVSWGEHGFVAVVEAVTGIQAAFHFYELNS